MIQWIAAGNVEDMSWLCRHCIIAYAYACAFAQDENALVGGILRGDD